MKHNRAEWARWTFVAVAVTALLYGVLGSRVPPAGDVVPAVAVPPTVTVPSTPPVGPPPAPAPVVNLKPEPRRLQCLRLWNIVFPPHF